MLIYTARTKGIQVSRKGLPSSIASFLQLPEDGELVSLNNKLEEGYHIYPIIKRANFHHYITTHNGNWYRGNPFKKYGTTSLDYDLPYFGKGSKAIIPMYGATIVQRTEQQFEVELIASFQSNNFGFYLCKLKTKLMKAQGEIEDAGIDMDHLYVKARVWLATQIKDKRFSLDQVNMVDESIRSYLIAQFPSSELTHSMYAGLDPIIAQVRSDYFKERTRVSNEVEINRKYFDENGALKKNNWFINTSKYTQSALKELLKYNANLKKIDIPSNIFQESSAWRIYAYLILVIYGIVAGSFYGLFASVDLI